MDSRQVVNCTNSQTYPSLSQNDEQLRAAADFAMNGEQQKFFLKIKETYSKQLAGLQELINIACNQNAESMLSGLRVKAHQVRSEYEKFVSTTDIAGAFLSDDDYDPCSEVPRKDMVTSNRNKVISR